MKRIVSATAIALAMCALVALTPGAARAQTPSANGQLTVTVRDTTGVLPGAVVTLVRRDASAAVVRRVADAVGDVVFADLAPGTYDVTAAFSGFADARAAGVSVGAGAPARLELVLGVVQFSSEVTVTTANRREQLLLDVAEPTVLIDRPQIEDTGARTAKDLLLEQAGAGVQVHAGGGQGHLSINGIPNSGVLVLIDGRRYLGKDANGSFNLEDLPLAGIDRVEIVKGAGSALYGSDALGGVVNFVTRRSTAPGSWSAFNASGGSYGDQQVSETAGWRGSRGGVTVGGAFRQYDGFDLSEANPQTIGQPESQWVTGDVKADVRLTGGLVARVATDYSKREIRNYFFSGATQLPSTVYDSQRDLTRTAISPGLDYQISPTTSVSLNYTHGRYLRDETRVFTVDGNIVPQDPWREWNDEVTLSGQHVWQAFGLEHPLQGGYEHRQEKLRRSTLTVADPSRDINVLWFQQEVGLGSRLRITGGARYDDFSDFGSHWSPRSSAVFSVTRRQRAHVSYGHGFRPPYFGELYLNTPPSFVGNPNLKPETSATLTAGYAWAGARGEVSADYYRARVENGITFDLSGFPFTYGNLSEYTSQGTNLSATVALPGGLSPSVSYAFNKRTDSEGDEIGGYPNHSVFVKLLWVEPRHGWRANLRGQILGEVPPAADGSYQPGYDVWSAQVSKRLTASARHAISLYVQAANLFDKRDIFRRTAAGDPVAGDFIVWIAPRTFLAGLNVDLGQAR